MKPERSMAFVGVTETISLRIRQQVRRIEERLEHDWKWVSADNPDLVFIDPDSDNGKMARGRAKVTGMRFIEVCDEDMKAGDAPTLRVPIEQDALVALLNEAGKATISTGELAFQNSADFYFRDLQDEEGGTGMPAPAAENRPAPGLDDIIRRTELSDGHRAEQRLDTDAEVSAGGARTQRSVQFADRAIDRGIEVDTDGADPTAATAERHAVDRSVPASSPAGATGHSGGSAVRDTAHTTGEREAVGWQLPHFLGDSGPTRPSLYQIQGAPILHLDPKSRQFFADGDLSLLAPYCETGLATEGWTAVNSAQLTAMRAMTPRPYSELTWLYTWLNGAGRLDSKLDPGGSFRVRQRIDISPDFRQHHAILANMQTPSRLHEIAADAKVSMDQVFNLINAYHAIDALEWTRRAPREPLPAAGGKDSGSLLKRLWPFNRS